MPAGEAGRDCRSSSSHDGLTFRFDTVRDWFSNTRVSGTPALSTQEHACALLAGGIIDCWGNNAQGEIGAGTTTNQPQPTVVNSFAANVDPAVTMRNGRIAEVTALINCDSGGDAEVILNLEQGSAKGTGRENVRCEGRLLQVPMTVPAQGPSAFQAASATAHVEAIVRTDGSIVEDTHWTRQVIIDFR